MEGDSSSELQEVLWLIDGSHYCGILLLFPFGKMASVNDSVQLVDGRGVFNITGLGHFVERVKMADKGLQYAVVSIMGRQSTGKSTLLNHLFGTEFQEMNAKKGRTQTTKGIWLARCNSINDPFTVVMDIEGTDGRERGEGDTAFEKQSTLFALVVSDILIINMWCTDVGGENAANYPLLRIVFQAMMKLSTRRKTILLFIIRDMDEEANLKQLEDTLKKDIEKIWKNVNTKPKDLEGTRFSNFFNVHVVALPHYKYRLDSFKKEVANLRQSFYRSISPGGLAAKRGEVVPALGFALSAEQIWKVIKENKDLDLPAHKILVANTRCEEIANDNYNRALEAWNRLVKEAAAREAMDNDNVTVPNFGKHVKDAIDECLAGYDNGTVYFDERPRTSKREQLLSKLGQIKRVAYDAIMEGCRLAALHGFQEAFGTALENGEINFEDDQLIHTRWLSKFDELVNQYATIIKEEHWNASEVRANLARDMTAHGTSIQLAKLDARCKEKDEIISQLRAFYDKQHEENKVMNPENKGKSILMVLLRGFLSVVDIVGAALGIASFSMN